MTSEGSNLPSIARFCSTEVSETPPAPPGLSPTSRRTKRKALSSFQAKTLLVSLCFSAGKSHSFFFKKKTKTTQNHFGFSPFASRGSGVTLKGCLYMTLQKKEAQDYLGWGWGWIQAVAGPKQEEEALPHGDLPLAPFQEQRELVLGLQHSFLEMKCLYSQTLRTQQGSGPRSQAHLP